MIRRIILLILSAVMGSMPMIAQNILDLSGKNPSLKIKEYNINFKEYNKKYRPA